MPPRLRLHLHKPAVRQLSTTASPSQPTPLPPRWLPITKARIGRCITFGLTREQKAEAGLLSGELAQDWRQLLAGSEGFVVGGGLLRRRIEWGEMDSMVRTLHRLSRDMRGSHC